MGKGASMVEGQSKYEPMDSRIWIIAARQMAESDENKFPEVVEDTETGEVYSIKSGTTWMKGDREREN